MLISITANSIRGAADLCIAALAVSAPAWKEPSLTVVDDFREIKVPRVSLKAL